MLPTYEQAVRQATKEITESGSITASLDASLLLERVTGKTRVEIFTYSDDKLSTEQKTDLDTLVKRRCTGEPMAYILGEREFWGMPFKVKPGILIPRPDTETLIGTLCALIGESRQEMEGVVVDVGTGSGAIITSILKELPKAQGIGVDISEEALSVTRENADANGVGDRLELRQGSYLGPLDEEVSIIVSNPPYIRTDVLNGLDVDVRDFEPHLALDGGQDGLVAYKSIIPQAKKRLGSGGLLMLEIGYDQKDDILELLNDNDWSQTQSFKDLGANDRVIVAIRA